MSDINKLSLKEKLGYGLGDGAANIAWRGVATFLFIFYTDVFGLNPAAVGILMLVARSSDGISDVPVSQVWFSIISITVFYAILFVMDYILTMTRIKQGIVEPTGGEDNE